MFRRKTSPAEPAPPTHERPGAKNRPTPTRKEAEAAARERARLGKDRKALAKRQRELRLESSRKVREGMKTGEERLLPARDRGPVKRFIRDFVDTRLGFAELLAPVLLLILLLSAFGESGRVLANSLWVTTILLLVLDVLWLRFRVRRAVRARFPENGLKGVTLYAVMRSINMRFLRMPKTQRKIGEPLPDTYR